MKPLIVFVMFCLSTLHAQWIMDVGEIRLFYADPELMKKNDAMSFVAIPKVHDQSLPKDLRTPKKWMHKETFWINQQGYVFCGGEKYGNDTIAFHTFQPIPGDTSKWMMTWDSIYFQNDRFYLYNKGYMLEKYLTMDDQGRLVSSKYVWNNENNSSINFTSWRYYYKGDRLDSIMINNGKTVYRYQYNDQNQLTQIMEYGTFGYSDSISLRSTITYAYRKDGLPKKLRQDFIWYTKYWSVTRFRWKKN